MTIPNLITIGRLVLVPLTVWLLISGKPLLAFVCFVMAGASDAIDGFLARRLDQRSDLGAYLDPLADKALLVSIYVALAMLNELPVWITILVVSRDLFIVAAVVLSWMIGQPIEVKPLAVSKINTVAQIVLAAFVLGDLALGSGLDVVRMGLIYLVAALTVASAGAYLVDWVQHMGGIERPHRPDGDHPK
ncbi:CDP-alcohol phosphatidyltransferase family protein [soil metagenome]